MIKIEFSLAIAVYIILTAVVVLFLWLLFGKKKSSNMFFSENRFFWQCDICMYVYVDSRHNVISKCPKCGSLNKKETP
jgi:rubrerythrin